MTLVIHPFYAAAQMTTPDEVVDGLLAVVAAVSPVLLRYFPASGLPMALVSFVLAALIALIAGLATGQFDGFQVSSIQSWLVTAGWLWALQQGAYRALKTILPGTVGDAAGKPLPQG